jgi:hypothetical protein
MTMSRSTSRQVEKGSNDELSTNGLDELRREWWRFVPRDPGWTPIPLGREPSYSIGEPATSGERRRSPEDGGDQSLRELRCSLWLDLAELHHLATSEALVPAHRRAAETEWLRRRDWVKSLRRVFRQPAKGSPRQISDVALLRFWLERYLTHPIASYAPQAGRRTREANELYDELRSLVLAQP